MTIRFRQDVASALRALPASSSGLVRRLILRSQGDPARRRILAWLVAVDEARLLQFGLTLADISILRSAARVRGLTISPAAPAGATTSGSSSD
jgi:hypothetical protein